LDAFFAKKTLKLYMRAPAYHLQNENYSHPLKGIPMNVIPSFINLAPNFFYELDAGVIINKVTLKDAPIRPLDMFS